MLIKSVLNSIPIHTLSVNWFLESTLHKVETLIKNFLWQKNLDTKGIHLVNWDIVTTDKNMDGLSVQDLSLFKHTLQVTPIQRYLNKDDSLWCTVTHAKYGSFNPWFPLESRHIS